MNKQRPLWIEAQLNGKTAQENYNTFKEQQREKIYLENLEKEKIEKQLDEVISKSLEEILS